MQCGPFLALAFTFALAFAFGVLRPSKSLSQALDSGFKSKPTPRLPSFSSSLATAMPLRCTSSPSRVKPKRILETSRPTKFDGYDG